MNLCKIISIILGAICFFSAIRGHYIIAAILFVFAVLIAQRSAEPPRQE